MAGTIFGLGYEEPFFYEGRAKKPKYYCPWCDEDFTYSLRNFCSHLKRHGYRPNKALINLFFHDLYFDDKPDDYGIAFINESMMRSTSCSFSDLFEDSETFRLRTLKENNERSASLFAFTKEPDAFLEFDRSIAFFRTRIWPRELSSAFVHALIRVPDIYLSICVLAIESGYQAALGLPTSSQVSKLRKEAIEQAKINAILARKSAEGVAPDEVSPLDRTIFSSVEASEILQSKLDLLRHSDERIRNYIRSNPAPDPLGNLGMSQDKRYRGRNQKGTIKVTTSKK